MFSWRAEVRPGVWVAFTDAAAGNLALHVGDSPLDVRRRRGDVAAAAGLAGRPFRYMNQVHGNEVAVIGAATTAGRRVAAPDADARVAAPTADAMVSLGEPLAVMVADRVPVVLVGDRADGETPVLAVVHAGRPGVASGVVPAAITRMRELGAARLSAWIGPSVCGRCYEVPEDMRRDVAARVPAAWCTTARAHRAWTCRPPSAANCRTPAWRSNTPATAPWKTNSCSPTAATRTPGDSPDSCGRTEPRMNTPIRSSPTGGHPDPRLEQLRERLAAVRERIDNAVAAAGRADRPPRLIVVTKFHPAEDVRRLAALGVTDVGENRDQEAAEKAAAAGRPRPELALHRPAPEQEGQVCGEVRRMPCTPWTGRPLVSALAKAMAAESERTGRAPLDCFIQVSLDDDAGGPPRRRSSDGGPGTGRAAGGARPD